MRHRGWSTVVVGAALVMSALPAFGSAADASATSPQAGPGGVTTGLAAGNPFCQHLGARYQASSGAQLFCFGAKLKVTGNARRAAGPVVAGAPRNVDAASYAEDVTPNLAHVYGQSETSIAAAGRYVVEAWNDATGFASTCTARDNKAEMTGLGFSANGGRSFTDLGGLPNPVGCTKFRYEGDPSVVAYQAGGRTYFYISSLFNSITGTGTSAIAFDACQATGSGRAARLHCGRPVIAAESKQCMRFKPFGFCSFLDKDFMSIDPARGRLYISYTEFPVIGKGTFEEASACDLGTRRGGAGPAGGTPAKPVCETGTPLVKQPGFKGHFFAGSPYFTVAGKGFRGCENEGAYPAVNVATGALYVAYEFNWATNLFDSNCMGFRAKTREFVTRTPFGCLKLAAVAGCARPANVANVAVYSLDAASVPGYNRFPLNDFPRIAVSSRFGDVTLVWNDARRNALGDVLLQSFRLGSLKRVQRFPIALDQPHHGGLTMMPGLRVSNANGMLDIAWYSRASATTARTSLDAAINVSPAATRTPRNIAVTNVTSNWLYANSDIIPNFGDYVDVVVSATGHLPYVGNTVYFAWSDGRTTVPQPFAAHLSAGG